jgi:hypothetical protein
MMQVKHWVGRRSELVVHESAHCLMTGRMHSVDTHFDDKLEVVIRLQKEIRDGFIAEQVSTIVRIDSTFKTARVVI